MQISKRVTPELRVVYENLFYAERVANVAENLALPRDKKI
jgi:hypothetical protein